MTETEARDALAEGKVIRVDIDVDILPPMFYHLDSQLGYMEMGPWSDTWVRVSEEDMNQSLEIAESIEVGEYETMLAV